MRYRSDPYRFVKSLGGMFVPMPLRFAPGYPCCCEGEPNPECQWCRGESIDDIAASVTAEISGVANKSPVYLCSTCASINGTYVLDWIGDTGYGFCLWAYNYGSSNAVGFAVYENQWALSVSCYDSTQYGGSLYKSKPSGTVDCLNIDVALGDSYLSDACSMSGASAHVYS